MPPYPRYVRPVVGSGEGPQIIAFAILSSGEGGVGPFTDGAYWLQIHGLQSSQVDYTLVPATLPPGVSPEASPVPTAGSGAPPILLPIGSRITISNRGAGTKSYTVVYWPYAGPE